MCHMAKENEYNPDILRMTENMIKNWRGIWWWLGAPWKGSPQVQSIIKWLNLAANFVDAENCPDKFI